MKTIAAVTPNNNLIYSENGLNLIFLDSKQHVVPFVSYHGVTSVEELLKTLPNKEIETTKIISDEETILKQTKLIDALRKENEELREIKSFFGDLPEWFKNGFKSEEKYQKFLKKEATKKFYSDLKKNFKLKTNKAVDMKLCWVYTTEYSGKNGGFRNFNRSINKTIYRIENLKDYSRNRNLIVKNFKGEVLENRGNIEISECN